MITVSQRVCINQIHYHTKGYDACFESLNDHCIEYLNNTNDLSYGLITNFIKVDPKKFYCIVEQINVYFDDNFFKILDSLTLKHINKFFLMVKMSHEYEIIECHSITRKCILFEYKNSIRDEKMLMPCENLEECD